jgi:YfiH family protein
MKLCEKEGLRFWEFDLLKSFPEISHGSFLRTGGVSPVPFASLNVAEESGDAVENVRENTRRIQALLKVSHVVSARQCHGQEIYILKDLKAPIPPCDALITPLQDTALLIKHADCQAGFFYDPVHEVIALVHAGWRGSIQQIYTKTIAALKNHFGSRPENLRVCISPSLGPAHAEFIHYRTELPPSFLPFRVGEHHFDFWALSAHELKEAGVMPHHIEIARQCTYAAPEDYFSYRRQKDKGRLASVIARRFCHRI